MRKTLLGIAVLLLVAATPALADITCAAHSICTVQLTQADVNGLSGVQVTVTINNMGSKTVLGFQLTKNPQSPSNGVIGIDKIAWDGFGSIDSQAYGWHKTFHGGSNFGDVGGFGSFAFEGAALSNDSGVNKPVYVTLNGLLCKFPKGSFEDHFIVHIKWKNCSGWIGDHHNSHWGGGGGWGWGGWGDKEKDKDCNNHNPPPGKVPEPGSVVLLGSGLAGLAGLLKRKLGV